VRCAKGRNSSIDYFPDIIAQLHIFNVLGKIVQPTQQAERIVQRREGRLTQAGGHSQPGLLPQLHHDAVFNFLDVDGQRRVPARHHPYACCDLHSDPILIAHYLCIHIPTVKLCDQSVGEIVWRNVSVKNSSVHVFDYNPLYERRRNVVVFYLS